MVVLRRRLVDIDLDPADLASERVGNWVIVGDQRTALHPDIACVIRREDHRRRCGHLPFSSGLAVDE